MDDVELPDGRRRRRLGIGLGVGAATLAVAVAVTLAITTATAAPDRSSAPATTAASTSSAEASSTPSALDVKQPAPETTPTADADPAALADLDAVAATVPTPLALTSPATWDQWLPKGKPFPGASTEEEMSTCPRLSDRLGRVLGTKVSYWSGTLPSGPYGCTWVPVPLVYDSPDYDYVISVGFLADGTTPSGLARSFATAGGPCPWKELPEAAPDAVMVRCDPGPSTEYTLALPDTRLPGGMWTLIVTVKDRATVPASQILPVLIDGAVAAFG
jgi:hypothetical protein